MSMRSLEIRIQRIFNNLIKQNQKLGSNTVLKQSTIVSSVQSTAAQVQHPASRVQHPESSVQNPVSGVQCPELGVQRPESRVQGPASSVQRPDSSIQRPASRVQSPTSRVQLPGYSVQSSAFNTCVQGPRIPVCPVFTNVFVNNLVAIILVKVLPEKESPLMSVVLPLQIPQKIEVDPSTKAVLKKQASTLKMMKKKRTSFRYDSILLYLWVV